jgi:cyclopropane fatty-acyl-phospholipid synthase-like methyltransferase
MKQWSDACEENKLPILAVLQAEFAGLHHVLEIGSGTGQHAAFFAAQLPHLVWQASDLEDHLPSIRAWLAEARLSNTPDPVILDAGRLPWPVEPVDAVFSANTAHIMAWSEIEVMFAGIGAVLSRGGVFCLYGPFSDDARHTSESNARFDAWLKQRSPLSGVRDAGALDRLAQAQGLALLRDHAMPVNNRTLVWTRP